MRIVQFTRSFHLGGTESQVLELLRGLSGRHRVQVAVLQEAGPLIEAVWELGHLPRAFPLAASVARPTTGIQIGRLAFWLRQSRVELVHAQDFYSAVLAVPAAKLAGCKVVVGRLDLAHWYGPLRRAALTRLTRLADHVVANAEAIRRMLVDEERIAPEKVTVIHNGIDLASFDARAAQEPTGPLPDTRGQPVAVLLANMNPVKRQEDFLVALAMARHEGRKLHAFLVGDGVRRAELESLARGLGVQDVAHFLGHRQDVPALLRRATFGVLCSSAEGLPNAVIESMAAKLPMIATDVGGIPELVEPGKSGVLVKPYRPVEIHRAINCLLDDPESAQAMGQAGRAFVERSLTSDRLVKAHERLYEQVLEGGADRSSSRRLRSMPAFA